MEFDTQEKAIEHLLSLEDRQNFCIKCENDLYTVKSNEIKEKEIKSETELYYIDTEGANGVKSKVIYGDSVTPETSIMIKKDGKIKFTMIKNLHETDWEEYNNFKPLEKERTNKQKSSSKAEVWDGEKWSVIKKVIRHKVNKKIYRVLTHTGYVEVTEDHSLIDEYKNYIKPKDVKLGQKLFYGYPIKKTYEEGPIFDNIIEFVPKTIEEKEAYVMGLFFADGSCGIYNCPSGLKRSWAINKADRNLLEKCKDYLEDVYSIKFKILETMKSSHVLKLVPIKNVKFMTEKYRKIFYEDKQKIVPTIILNDNKLHMSFFSGYYAGDGSKNEKGYNDKKLKCIRFSNKGQVGTSGLFYIMRNLNLNVSMNCRNDKLDIFRLTGSNSVKKCVNEIKKLEEMKIEPDYVYDLETESGRFQAGIGTMIVKNTDSIYVEFNIPGVEKMSKDEILNKTWDVAEVCADRISNTFIKPIELELNFLGSVMVKSHC